MVKYTKRRKNYRLFLCYTTNGIQESQNETTRWEMNWQNKSKHTQNFGLETNRAMFFPFR